MSKTSRAVTVAALLAAVLAVGNPGLDSFAAYARGRIESAPGIVGLVAGLVPDLTRSYVLTNTRRRDFGLFSLFELDPHAEHPIWVLGMLWHFVPLGKGFGAAAAPPQHPAGN